MPTIETATDASSAQDVQARIESSLYPEDEVVEDAQQEPIEEEVDEVSDDDDDLPEDDDSEAEDDEGSDDYTLAKYLGVDEDRIKVNEDGSVSMVAVIDGKSQDVPLSELAKSYQLQGHVNNKSIAFEKERKEFEGNKEKALQELQTRIQGVNTLHQMAEDKLVSEYNNIDWDKLRRENPSEWSALRQEYTERAQEIQHAQSLAGQEAQRLQQEQQMKFQEQQQQRMQTEFTKMLENNPQWVDDGVRKQELDSMKSFLSSSYNFGEEDMQHVTDHRLVSLIQDAMKYRNGAKAGQEKIVKKVPKFQKPGAQKSQSASLAKARNVKAKRAAVKQSNGGIRDVASLIEDRM
jgi:hypothetical protein